MIDPKEIVVGGVYEGGSTSFTRATLKVVSVDGEWLKSNESNCEDKWCRLAYFAEWATRRIDQGGTP